MSQPKAPHAPEFLSSFGRRIGRRLKPQKQQLIDELLPRLQVAAPKDAVTKLVPAHLFPESQAAPIWLEIGFGGGEHLASLAQTHPSVNFIGAEPYYNGVASLLEKIEQEAITNIRVVADDIRPVMKALPDGTLERIYLLFPDPWPKPRHFKRRIVSQEFLAEVERLLPVGGILQLATDHYDYSVWMFEQVLQRTALRWTAGTHDDWHEPPKDWQVTRYETKTRAEGRKPVYLRFERV